MGYEAKSYNRIFVFTTALCTLSFFVIFKIFSVTGLGLWDNINGVLGSFEPILGMSSFWLYLVVVVVAAWTIFFHPALNGSNGCGRTCADANSDYGTPARTWA